MKIDNVFELFQSQNNKIKKVKTCCTVNNQTGGGDYNFIFRYSGSNL